MSSEILIIGAVILIGFIGNTIFEYTKIPESLFMIIIGLIIGPALGIVGHSEFIEIAPVVTTVTLIIVLLDTGLSLDLFKTIRVLGKAFLFTILVLTISTTLIGSVMSFLGWDMLQAILIGILGSGTTTIVVADLIPRLRVPAGISQILIMESIINDVTLLTAAVIIIDVMSLETVVPSNLISAFITSILVSITLGILFTIIWVEVLWRIKKSQKLAYVFTLGGLFILYSIAEFLNGNGAIAVLIMALLLGNLPSILNSLNGSNLTNNLIEKSSWSIHGFNQRYRNVLDAMRKTQLNFSFFTTNFFYVYIGVIFNMEELNFPLIVICGVILILMYVSRYLAVRLQSIIQPKLKEHTMIMTMVVARGFTATFTALLPASVGVEIPLLKEIVLIMVILSTFATIGGGIIYERFLLPKKEKYEN